MPSQTAVGASEMLRGHVLRVPSLLAVFARWPLKTNPHLRELRQTVDEKLNEWILDQKLRAKLGIIDIGLMIAVMYPDVSIERLETMAFYTLWLFIWDDDIDEPDTQCGHASEREIEKVHGRLLEYVYFRLGLTETAVPGEPGPLPPTPTTAIFRVPARDMKLAFYKAGRVRFCHELKFYLDSLVVELGHLQHKALPSLQSYWEQRLGTSGATTYFSLIEYVADMRIPAELLDTPELDTLWHETNRLIIWINDFVSIKKEMNAGGYSIVPVLMSELGQGIDAAVTSVVDDMRNAVDNFDSVAKTLLCKIQDPKTVYMMEKYIDVLRTMVTGCLAWSLASRRYDAGRYIQDDGSLVVPL